MTSESTYAWDSVTNAWCVQADSTLEFVYDGWMLVAKVDGATGRMMESYQWDPTKEAGVGGLLSETVYGDVNGTWQATATYVPVYDANANVVGMVDEATGAVAGTYTYSAYGSVLSQTWNGAGSDPNDILFSSHRYDARTGLIYMNQRWYSPTLGRFLSPDPSGEGSDVNRYRYCFDNPINSPDPIGLNTLSELARKELVSDDSEPVLDGSPVAAPSLTPRTATPLTGPPLLAAATAPGAGWSLNGRFFVQAIKISGTLSATDNGYSVTFKPLVTLPPGHRLVLVQAIEWGGAVSNPFAHIDPHIDTDASNYALNHKTSGGINPPTAWGTTPFGGPRPFPHFEDAPYNAGIATCHMTVVAIDRSTVSDTDATSSAAGDVILGAVNFDLNTTTGVITFREHSGLTLGQSYKRPMPVPGEEVPDWVWKKAMSAWDNERGP